jgi:hypothetical protein
MNVNFKPSIAQGKSLRFGKSNDGKKTLLRQINLPVVVSPVPTNNLLVRFNADSGITQSGGIITSWTDQENGIVATAFNGPILSPNQFNGRNAVSFDGINDYFTGTFGTQINNDAGRTFVIIGKYNTMVGQRGIFDGSIDLQAYIFQAGGSLYYNNGPQLGPITGDFTSNYFIQIINTDDNGLTIFRVNGTNRSTGVTSRPQMTGFNIGRRGNNNEYANFNMVELLVYNRSITLSEMQQIETYSNVI